MTESVRAERETVLVRTGRGFMQLSAMVYHPATERIRGTVYCLHDFVGVGRDYQRLAALLVVHGYKVIAPDFAGRGESAFLPADSYNRRLHGLALMQIMNHYGGERISVIAKGWGAMLMLVLLSRTRVAVRRLVLADLPFHYRLADELAHSSPLLAGEFASAKAAAAAMVATPSLMTLAPDSGLELARNRLRRTATGVVPHLDPQLLVAAERSRELVVDVTRLLTEPKRAVMLMSSEALTPDDRQKLIDLRRQLPRLVHAESLAPGGRIHFTTAQQQLVTLGFLTTRMPPREI